MSYVEASPLLQATTSANYSSAYPTAPAANDDPPPAYPGIDFKPAYKKECDVCNYMIDVSQTPHDYVVTCPRCSESTTYNLLVVKTQLHQTLLRVHYQCHLTFPLPRDLVEQSPFFNLEIIWSLYLEAMGNPPRGKRFVRCSCNKLLMYSSGATKIKCSRTGCSVEIDVQEKPAPTKQKSRSRNQRETISEPRPAPCCRFVCGHCNSVSVLDTAPGTSFTCRLCGKRSSVGRVGRKAIVSMVVGTAIVIAVLLIMASTIFLRHSSGYWWVYIAGLILAVFFLVHGLWMLCMKRSTVEVVDSTSIAS